MKNIMILLAFLGTIAFAQQEGSFIDSRDGKIYKTVKIGRQTWMAENLNYDAEGSKCYGEGGQAMMGYDEETRTTIKKTLLPEEVQDNCDKYGRLYDWAAAMKACPSGWHLPNRNEWATLIKFAGGEGGAGKKLKAAGGWNDGYRFKKGTDDYGFAALPGGEYSDHLYERIGRYGYWWTATRCNTNGTKQCSDKDYAYWNSISSSRDNTYGYTDSRFNLLSVRCLKN